MTTMSMQKLKLAMSMIAVPVAVADDEVVEAVVEVAMSREKRPAAPNVQLRQLIGLFAMKMMQTMTKSSSMPTLKSRIWGTKLKKYVPAVIEAVARNPNEDVKEDGNDPQGIAASLERHRHPRLIVQLDDQPAEIGIRPENHASRKRTGKVQELLTSPLNSATFQHGKKRLGALR